jgi:molybdate transport system substrate-binding protein
MMDYYRLARRTARAADARPTDIFAEIPSPKEPRVKTPVLASIVIAAIALAACSSAGGAPSPQATAAASAAIAPAASPSAAAIDLTIYGAASLKKALAEIKASYEAANPGTTITISTDSSTALATKIEQGAPADVFLSADTKNPQSLVDKGLAVGPVTKFAGNTLTVIVPTANPAGIRTPADLAKAGVKVIAAGDAVPITKYANQLVANLAKEAGYPADFAAKYATNIASKEDNVAAVVSKIALGEGDAGIVYATDATTSDKVATVPVPDSANVPATYGGVVVKASPNVGAATAFMDWLAGPDGQAILASLGFLAPY